MSTKKFWDWLVKSSVDPDKTSLSLKGFASLVANGLIFFGFLGKEDSDSLVEAVGILGFGAATAVSGIVTMFGLARKIANTWRL